MATKERRTARRFKMKLPLTVRWNNKEGMGEHATESQDVSSRGLTFSMNKEIKAGSSVEILMTLPHEVTLAGPVRVKCLGRIKRSETDADKKVGVTAEIERYEFVRGGENAA